MRTSGGTRDAGRRTRIGAIALVVAACGGARSPDPGEPPRPVAAAQAGAMDTAAAVRRGHTEADVRFVRRMIPHHAQALAMTSLVPERSTREEIRAMAERIALTQESEIAQMRRWLERRGEPAPAARDDHAGHHGAPAVHDAMPGMLTAEELARLTSARGAEFDRLFLELMIRHHEGAVAMVRELFASPGAGEETELFRIASDVNADQQAEIRRMRALRERLAPAGP